MNCITKWLALHYELKYNILCFSLFLDWNLCFFCSILCFKMQVKASGSFLITHAWHQYKLTAVLKKTVYLYKLCSRKCHVWFNSRTSAFMVYALISPKYCVTKPQCTRWQQDQRRLPAINLITNYRQVDIDFYLGKMYPQTNEISQL